MFRHHHPYARLTVSLSLLLMAVPGNLPRAAAQEPPAPANPASPQTTSDVQTLLDTGTKAWSEKGPSDALPLLEKALEGARKTQDKPREATALSHLGLVYRDLGQPQRALDSLGHALSLYQQVGDKNNEAGTLTNLGLACQDLGQPQKALDYFSQALPLHRQTGNKTFEANTLVNLGGVYNGLGQPQKALEYLQSISKIGLFVPIL